MDISTTLWLSELEMDDPMILSHQSQMSSPDESRYPVNPISLSPQGSYTPPPVNSSSSSFRSENNSKGSTTPPAKMLKTARMIPNPSTSTIISFHNAISETAQYDGDHVNDISSFLGVSEGNRKATIRNPLQAQDHVIAERQRRERLSQMFIQLSSLVPGLKKIDKASVLGEAANYIKQLQGRVKTLEEKVTEKDGEAIVSVDRSRPRFDEEYLSSSGDDNFADYNNESIPEIEVRISETEVFLRIQSNKIPGMAVKMLSDIEKLHMTIMSSSVMPFANNSLLITVIAQMNVEFCMTANDLMKRLQFAALKLGQEYAC